MESSNIVGFNNQDSGDGNNFITVAFNDIGFNTADIQQIKIDDGGAMSIGMGGEDFSVWEGLPTVVEGSNFFYLDPMLDPEQNATTYYWGDGIGGKTTSGLQQVGACA